MTKPTHTPTPWRSQEAVDTFDIYDADGERILHTYCMDGIHAERDLAKHVVEAVNSYHSLVAQVETLRRALDLIARFIEISTRIPKSERGYEKNNLITEARVFIAAATTTKE